MVDSTWKITQGNPGLPWAITMFGNGGFHLRIRYLTDVDKEIVFAYDLRTLFNFYFHECPGCFVFSGILPSMTRQHAEKYFIIKFLENDFFHEINSYVHKWGPIELQNNTNVPPYQFCKIYTIFDIVEMNASFITFVLINVWNNNILLIINVNCFT